MYLITITGKLYIISLNNNRTLRVQNYRPKYRRNVRLMSIATFFFQLCTRVSSDNTRFVRRRTNEVINCYFQNDTNH